MADSQQSVSAWLALGDLYELLNRNVCSGIRRVGRLDADLEEAVVEWRSWGGLNRHEAFTFSELRKVARPVMTIRVVSGSAEHRVGGETATAEARFSKGAASAEAPEVFFGARTGEGELW